MVDFEENERWWGRLEKWRVATESGGNETGGETGGPGGPGNETGDKTATTGGVMYTDKGELEFDEDEMAVLEGQRFVAEFIYGIY